MFINRLLQWLVISFISLWPVSVYAVDDCSTDTVALGIIDPQCQQTSLRGVWRAIPGKLIPPALINQYQAEAVSLNVPSYWPEEKVNVSNDYPRGLITLWVDLKLTGLNASGEGLAIWPGRQSSAMRMYVDNGRGSWVKTFDNLSVFIDESDQPIETYPKNNVAGELHHGSAFQLPTLYAGSRVILQLYVNDYRTGGIAQPPQIGPKDELYRNLMHRSSWHMLFLGACLLVTIFAASHAYFSSRRRKVHIFLVLMSLGAGLRLLVTGSLLAYMFPGLTVNHHFYLAWISFLYILGLVMSSQVFILPMIFERYTRWKKILLFLSAPPLFVVLLIPVLSVHEFLLIGHALRAFYITFTLIYVVFLCWQVWLKPKGQWPQLLGVVFILGSGAYDAYLYSQNIDPYIELFSIAMFVFIASQALYFGWEHMQLLGREQRLTMNLKNLNGSLEKQVRNRTRDLQTANAHLSHAATTDVLTNLPNRRAFDTEIDNEVLRAKCNDQTFCLAIADADWFKSVNDRYGHDIGDKALQALAACLRKTLRNTDFVARIGGEEFAIILPLVNIDSANVLLNKLCTTITTIRIDGAADYQPSISIGFAQWYEGLTIDELYRAADQGLYKAKHNGRGRVEAS